MKKYNILVLLILSSLICVSWGIKGHRTVGRFAQSHLSKEAKLSTEVLLDQTLLEDFSEYPGGQLTEDDKHCLDHLDVPPV